MPGDKILELGKSVVMGNEYASSSGHPPVFIDGRPVDFQ